MGFWKGFKWMHISIHLSSIPPFMLFYFMRTIMCMCRCVRMLNLTNTYHMSNSPIHVNTEKKRQKINLWLCHKKAKNHYNELHSTITTVHTQWPYTLLKPPFIPELEEGSLWALSEKNWHGWPEVWRKNWKYAVTVVLVRRQALGFLTAAAVTTTPHHLHSISLTILSYKTLPY